MVRSAVLRRAVALVMLVITWCRPRHRCIRAGPLSGRRSLCTGHCRGTVVCGKPLVDDFRVGPHCPNGIDCDVVFVVIEQGLFSIYLSFYVSFVSFDSYVPAFPPCEGERNDS